MKLNAQKLRRSLRHGLVIGLWTFGLAAISAFFSQVAVEEIRQVAGAFALLLVVILVGIAFDVVGVAAAAAELAPLNARAANRLSGARQAVWLVRNAARVASFCNDLVGDVSGTLSGAIGISIVVRLLQAPSERLQVWAMTLMTAFTAALVVGGKAVAKAHAIEHATQIIFHVGQAAAWCERVLRVRMVRTPRRAGPRGPFTART